MKVIVFSAIPALVLGSGVCSDDFDCQSNMFQTHCCWNPNDSIICQTSCDFTDASHANDYQGFISSFQEAASGSTSKDHECMSSNLNSNIVNNHLQNAYRYGSNRAIFSASSQFLQLGSQISDSAQTCQTFTEWIFSEVKTLAGDFVGVLKTACKYERAIEEGTALVGFPEAVPIEEAICDATKFTSEAYNVINMINQGIQCGEMLYNLNQYNSYAENADPSYTSTYDANVGAFAGKQFKYTKGCKALADKLKKTAFKKLGQEISGSFIDTDALQNIKIVRPERKLNEDTKYFSQPNCVYCLPEAEFIDFFQGFYDGQTLLDPNMTTLDIKTCLSNNDHLQQAYFGGVQASLTKIMLSYQNNDVQKAMDEIIRLQFDLELILDSKSCSELENLALLSNKALSDQIQVNGTKAFFINEDGIDVDVTATPMLVATLNQNLIKMQTEGSLSPSSRKMYEMGEQIGMTTKIVHVRGKKASKTWVYAVSISASVVLLSVLGFVLFKRNQKRNQTYDGVDNEETIN